MCACPRCDGRHGGMPWFMLNVASLSGTPAVQCPADQSDNIGMRETESLPNAFDGILIDDRNERPLRIALVAIVVVWSLALAITFAAIQITTRSTHLMDRVGAIAAFIDRS